MNLFQFGIAAIFVAASTPVLAEGGEDVPFGWENVTPRIGLTYALGRDRTPTIGFDVRGYVGTEYTTNGSFDDFTLGGSVKVGYGIELGSGVATFGGRIYGQLDGNFQIDPYVNYSWNGNKVSLGYVRSAEEYIVKPFATISNPLENKLTGHPLTLRFDTRIGDARVSASYNEFENFSLGAKFSVNDNFVGYAAAQYNTGSNNLSSTVGIFTKFNDHDIRLAYSCFGGGNHLLEGEASYDFTDRLRGSVYAGFDFSGSNVSTTLAGELNYKVTDAVTASAGVTHNSDFVDPRTYRFSVGFRF